MKHLYEIESGGRFIYGGVEWVKLAADGGTVLTLAADSLFQKAFDEENCNDWRKSSSRKYLNGAFLDKLVDAGADYSAFVEFDSDLTADDGMKNYGSATDKIALLSCDQYREYRDIIPMLDEWWWTLTPWTCNPEYSYDARCVSTDGALDWNYAYYGDRGLRPLCNLKSEILVSVQGEEDEPPYTNVARSEIVEEARDAILTVLTEDYPVDIWGDALGAAVASLFTSKLNADEAEVENRARHEQK